MSVKFNVKISEKHILDFQLYHGRTHFAGILRIVAIFLCLGLGVWNGLIYAISDSIMCFVIAGILFFFPRQQLKAKAKRQIKSSEMFQQEIEYEFDENGITSRQGDMEVKNEWSAVEKVVSTRMSIILYTSRVRAIIYPKKFIGTQYDELVKLIRENVPATKVKIR